MPEMITVGEVCDTLDALSFAWRAMAGALDAGTTTPRQCVAVCRWMVRDAAGPAEMGGDHYEALRAAERFDAATLAGALRESADLFDRRAAALLAPYRTDTT